MGLAKKKIILLNKKENGYPFTMLAKGQRIIFIYFFVIERSDTILIEKSHYFVAFFWSMYIHTPCLPVY